MGGVGATVGAIGGALGQVLSGEGERKAQSAARRAHEANARSLEEQAKFAQFVKERKLAVFKRQSQLEMGDTVSRYAKAGVDISGTPLMQMAFQQSIANEELQAIEKEGQMNVSLLRQQASQERANAWAIRRAQPFMTMGRLFSAAGGIASGMAQDRRALLTASSARFRESEEGSKNA